MDIKKIRDLDIAKEPFNLSSEIKSAVDYCKWVDYISKHTLFVWYEDTDAGKNILANIDKIPDNFKDSILTLLNKVRCFSAFNSKKNTYNISVGYSKESKKISISFERPPKRKDLKLFLDMANYLDALLLNHGNEIIDEEVINSLE
jgi:hypothetical protein